MSSRDTPDLERRLQNVTERLLVAFEELDFLHSMSTALARPEALGDVYRFLLDESLGLFHADGGWLARKRPGAGFSIEASAGFPDPLAEALNSHLAGPLAETRALPFLVDDLPGTLARQPRLLNGIRLPEADPPDSMPRAFLAASLEVNTEVLGVICLAKRSPGDVFTAGDSKLLATLATQASLYIKNADLVDALRAEARTLGQRVKQLEADPRGHPDLSWIRGPSPAMLAVSRQVEAAAATDATVLLLGESGTGKSLVARILHGLSARRGAGFVELNCGAVAPGVIESELFGHSRGSFTGADKARPGLFEEADRGTIFLDEVAELPLEMQVKLLNVLERQRVRRVGENKDRLIDARVIAATNADLSVAVREGRFREDLFYRLNVLNLTIPPLRQRKEDILHLADRFLNDLARETNRRIRGFTPEAREVLGGYGWPGNVRELRNVVERGLLLKTSGEFLEPGDLVVAPRGVGGPHRARVDDPGTSPLPEAVAAYERRLILEALGQNGGVVAKAAGALGISRTNLHNKLKKHDLVGTRAWGDQSQDS